MERTLYTERLYSLGDFKNIKFSQAISNIPEEIGNDPVALNLLYMQMYQAMELAYREYYAMVEFMARERVSDVVEHLKKEQEQTYTQLIERIGARKHPELIPQEEETK